MEKGRRSNSSPGSSGHVQKGVWENEPSRGKWLTVSAIVILFPLIKYKCGVPRKQLSSAVDFSYNRAACGPCSNLCDSRIFPTFYGSFGTHVFNAGLFLLLGRILVAHSNLAHTCGPPGPAVTRVNHVGLLASTPTCGRTGPTSPVVPTSTYLIHNPDTWTVWSKTAHVAAR